MLCQSRTTTALTTSCGTMLDSLLHCIYTLLSHTGPTLSLRLHIHPYTHTHTLSECSFRCHCSGRRPHGQSRFFRCHSHSRQALRRRCCCSHPFHRSPSWLIVATCVWTVGLGCSYWYRSTRTTTSLDRRILIIVAFLFVVWRVCCSRWFACLLSCPAFSFARFVFAQTTRHDKLIPTHNHRWGLANTNSSTCTPTHGQAHPWTQCRHYCPRSSHRPICGFQKADGMGVEKDICQEPNGCSRRLRFSTTTICDSGREKKGSDCCGNRD